MESEDFSLDEIVNSTIEWASSPSLLNLKPTSLTTLSLKSSPSLKLKALPKYLKYVYLGEQETFPVIIASHLNDGKEDDLKAILRKHREAIG